MKELAVARGFRKADLVLKNAKFINVFTERVEYGDIAVCGERIVGIGEYDGKLELDCSDLYVASGFIDGHIHLESSMMKPTEFAKAVLPHGTTAVITDPHEIANVSGLDGIEYMLAASEGLPLEVFFTLPSCVPATAYDENGYTLLADDLMPLYKNKRTVGLAEVMDYYGTIHEASDILQKIEAAKAAGKVVDGHAPGLHGKDACAYCTAGVQSDHECISLEEALEKLRLGQWIMIREGTAAKNLEALMGLFSPPYHQRAMLVTDDKHPYDILYHGHMDDILKKAVSLGADPCIAVKMATFNTASYFGLKDRGAVAPGYRADLVLLNDLKDFSVSRVIKDGRVVAEAGQCISWKNPEVSPELMDRVCHTFHCGEMVPEDFRIPEEARAGEGYFRAIQLVEGEITTREIAVPVKDGKAEVDVKNDILKLTVIERHHDTKHIGIGFIHGYGLRQGAIASSVSHDSHNIIAVGTNDPDIATAANCIREMQGGWAIALNGKIIGKLPLSIAGLISDQDAVTLSEQIRSIKELASELGTAHGIDPFMSLAFVSLPVIPKLRLTTTGIFDVDTQRFVSLYL